MFCLRILIMKNAGEAQRFSVIAFLRCQAQIFVCVHGRGMNKQKPKTNCAFHCFQLSLDQLFLNAFVVADNFIIQLYFELYLTSWAFSIIEQKQIAVLATTNSLLISLPDFINSQRKLYFIVLRAFGKFLPNWKHFRIFHFHDDSNASSVGNFQCRFHSKRRFIFIL